MHATDSELIKDSMILGYKQALADAQYQVLMLTGQVEVKDRRIFQLEDQLTNPEPSE